jgi:hypothetical protein
MELDTPGGLHPIRPQRPERRPSLGQPATLTLQIPEELTTLMRQPPAIQLEIALESFLPFRELQPVIETSQLEPVSLARPSPWRELANVRISKTVA